MLVVGADSSKDQSTDHFSRMSREGRDVQVKVVFFLEGFVMKALLVVDADGEIHEFQ